ncbi:MAG: anthranilate phosphoribosyltransferase [Anaerolineales bacterium]
METPEYLKPYLTKVIQYQDLSLEEAEAAMSIIMSGQATPAQIAAYLVALRMKGETVSEIVGSAKAMRAAAEKVNLTPGRPIVDVVGTGGDSTHSFNISTAAAFVVAAAGQRVAKHGNRAVSSQCGAADVLLALGANLDLTPEQVGEVIEETGIGFLFAPKFHPAMKYAIAPRRELGQRTIFNLLGPLTNPAQATHLLVGVYDPQLTEIFTEVLKGLGGQAAYVVHSQGGYDELTTIGKNRISQLKDGKVTTFEFDPLELGLRPANQADLRGGTPAENATRMRALFSGKDTSILRDVILLNAAAALALCDHFDIQLGYQYAKEALDSGGALEKLESFVQMTQQIGK